MEICHLKAAGPRNWRKAALAMAMIDSARSAGVDIQANMYPYTAGGTSLTACFPPSASADGRLFQNLADPRARSRIRAEIQSPTEEWENLCDLATPEGTLLLGLGRSAHRRFVGRYLADVARELGKDWIDTALDLVLEEGQGIGTVFFMMSEENVAMQLGPSWMKFGTDASGLDPTASGGLAHPRARSGPSLSRMQCGRCPHQLSTGVQQVFVNGQAVVANGVHTGVLAGRALRGPGWTGWAR